MEIFLAQHRGFCYGVKRAVELANNCVNNEGPTYTLGPIIHNPQMVRRLADKGIGMADNVTDVDNGTIIIRSHGVGPTIYEAAENKQLNIVDATCPHVKKAQLAARELASQGYQVVIIGERKHPEVKSIFEWAGNCALIVEDISEAKLMPTIERLGVVAQTTFAADAFQAIVDILKTKTEDLSIKRTICTATDLRQQAAIELAKQVDIMIVIGGKNSANTTHLAELCAQAGCITHHIETAEELKQEWFKDTKKAGITAGASTPDWLIEEVYSKMQEMNEVNDSIKEIQKGSIVSGKVVSVRKDEVFIDIGYKSEGVITLAELAYPTPESGFDVVKEGDLIDVYVIDTDGQDGLNLSKVKADKILAWDKLTTAQQENLIIEGEITEAVKGGLGVSVFGIRGFIPASQVDLRYTEDLTQFLGQSFPLKVIEVDETKQRAVLSRRLVLEEERRLKEQAVYADLKVNDVITGKVTRIAEFGAFVDLGGVDGLIHISDLSWERVKTPYDVLDVGQEVTAIVTKVDAAAKRISLSLKQISRDPWLDLIEQFNEGSVVKGKVTKITNFGAFVEIAKGIEGLVRLSELAEKKISKAEEVVSVGQEVNVKIIEIDKAKKRLALSIYQASQDAERAEYQEFITQNKEVGLTLGDKFGHLFKRED